MLRLARGPSAVAWAEGTVVVEVGGDVLLIDAPSGADERLGPAVLGRTRAILCTSGRIRAVGGLVPLLCALERHRGPDDTLVLHVPLGEDRAAALAEVWTRGWPDRYPLTIDAQRPGAAFEVGGIGVRTAPVRTGDVRWATGEVERGVGMAVRVATPDLEVAVILGAAAHPGLARLCAGADLAIVEVGVADWPRTDAPWRLRVDEAAAITAGAAQVWVVGDDGKPVSDATG